MIKKLNQVCAELRALVNEMPGKAMAKRLGSVVLSLEEVVGELSDAARGVENGPGYEAEALMEEALNVLTTLQRMGVETVQVDKVAWLLDPEQCNEPQD